MRLLRSILTVSLGCWSIPSATAESDSLVDLALKQCESGQYEAGLRAIKKAPKGSLEGQLVQAKCNAYIGRYDEATKGLLKASRRARGSESEAQALQQLVKLFQQGGDHKNAFAFLGKSKATNDPKSRESYLLAKSYLATGQSAKAEAIFQKLLDAEQAGSIDTNNWEQLFFVAEAGRAKGHFQYANESYRDALEKKADEHEINLAWGEMFLEKFAPGNAAESFEEILKSNPNHPDALAGMARVRLEENYNVAEALDFISKALEVNPKHQAALVARASIEIDRNQWKQAKKTLNGILRDFPNQLDARSLLATIHWLRDQNDDYLNEKNRIFSINPEFGRFFHLVGRSAVREHRYKRAIELYQEAVKLNPKDFAAMEAVGTGFLRLADEKKGLQWLERAYAGDRYNVRTVNTLELFDEYIPKNYEFADTKHFRLRLHKKEKDVLLKTIAPLLEEAYSSMETRYGFEPKKPTTVELFNSSEHYSVRTIGLPNLGALGVCFGRVITALSPSTGDVNWGMVLWHELAHVFAIQISNSRVPRWYTEGLSEYETIIARPNWRRENDGDIAVALKEGTLPSVAELNYGFMKPDRQQVVVAYHLSSVTIQYIAETYGFDTIVRGLKLFGEGLETPEVIARITGKSVTKFDKEFRTYLKKRLRPYLKSWHLPTNGLEDLPALADVTKKKPRSASAWTKLALAAYYAGNAKQAQLAAQKALDLQSENAEARFVLAEMKLRGGDSKTSRRLFEELLRSGHDNAEIRARLAFILRSKGEVETAIKHLCSAIALDPEGSYPYRELHEIYQEQKNDQKSLEALERYVSIEQMEFAPIRKLVTAYAERKQWAKAVAYGENAQRINPFDAEILLVLGRGNNEIERPKKALFAFETALKTNPALRRPALAYLGMARSHLLLKETKNARKSIQKALALEPENSEALRLSKSISAK